MNKQNVKKAEQIIFKKGSTTFFTSSAFFSSDIKKNISTLYAFVRTVDNFVDSMPQKIDEYNNFKNQFIENFHGKYIDNPIISNFVAVMKSFSFPYEWIQAFFNSMEMDMYKNSYETIAELEHYMHGTAEVIGLMIATILKLPHHSFIYAKLLGKAMQWINFIRDINEDISYGRVYIPIEVLDKHNIKKNDLLKKKFTISAFSSMIHYCISLYFALQKESEKGFDFIPYKKLLPIKTASDMYKWTAHMIKKNPMVIFLRKIKPSKVKIILSLLLNALICR